MKYDYLIAGAGFSGAVLAERIANVCNKKVLVVDLRNHIGGNCYDYRNEDNLLIHKYGPHIFHTLNKKVWDYLSQFTEWHTYYHRVLGVIDGQKVPVPFNINSINKCFPKARAEKLVELLLNKFGYGIKIPILKLMENKDKDLKHLADFIYDKVFLGYNLKQWGLKPEELDPSVSSRVPVFISNDDRYFQDTYQGIPKEGYTAIFEKLLNHDNIEVRLNTDYRDINSDDYRMLIYTGAIDSFFDFKYGDLPYRSLQFEMQYPAMEYFQDTAQINYPNDFDYTRITEFKHFHDYPKMNKTAIAYEFPQQFQRGINEPYYPIPKKENNELFAKYRNLADEMQDKVLFVGRLADYKYYNMDQVVGVALLTFEKKIIGRTNE